jgi:hypothetical protein
VITAAARYVPDQLGCASGKDPVNRRESVNELCMNEVKKVDVPMLSLIRDLVLRPHGDQEVEVVAHLPS